jgi:hypothetical protein
MRSNLCNAAHAHRVLCCAVLCRKKVQASGDGALPPLVAIVTDAGSASKEQGNFIIKDAASTSMSFWGSPFR